jgi:hypothetical protein
VHKAKVELITEKEFREELSLMLAQCSHEDWTICSNLEKNDEPDAAAAWDKIDSIFGYGTMEEQSGKKVDEALNYLSLLAKETVTKSRSIYRGIAAVSTSRKEK